MLISQTKDFNEDNTPITVSGATVQISTGDSSVVLTENAPGVYESGSLKGIPGTTYNLQVRSDAETFNATCTMPSLVKMDSLYITEEMFFGDNYKLPTVGYVDPAGVLNFYRLRGFQQTAYSWAKTPAYYGVPFAELFAGFVKKAKHAEVGSVEKE
mgnify:CR=1 FL=1